MKFQITDPDGWFQALRVGSFPNEGERQDGGKVYVSQVVSADTLRLLVRNWEAAGRPELLIDRDHQSEDPEKTTEAMGWLADMRVEGDRLLCRSRWSEEGEQLLGGGSYRWCSLTLDAEPEPGQPEAAGGSRGHRLRVAPQFITRVALTNVPAVGGLKPISNRAEATAPRPATIPQTNPTAKMDLTKLAAELKLPATATLEEITAAVVSIRNRADAADKATAEETLTRLKNRIPAGQEDYFRQALQANREPTRKLLESLPEQAAGETAPGFDTTRVHNRAEAGTKGTPKGVAGDGGKADAADIRAQQDRHLIELRNRLPNATRAGLVLQARAEKPEIWPA